MRLTIIIDVPPSIDHRTTDPHDVGQDVVAAYNETAEANGDNPVDFVTAEWGTRAPL